MLNDVLKCGHSGNKPNCYFPVPVLINIGLAKTDVQMACFFAFFSFLFFLLIIQNTKDRAIRTPLKTGGVCNFCSTFGTRRVTLVYKHRLI